MEQKLKVNLNEYLPLRDIVFNTLREAILKGDFAPGERLMEKQLAERMGVSRTPIREAIRKLELEGLVIMVPRKGAEVASITNKDIIDVLEVRATLEALAVKLACKKMSDEELDELVSVNEEFRIAATKKDVETIINKDVEFHDIIFHSSDNEKLIQIINNLREQIYRFRVEYIYKMENYDQLVAEHDEIVNAMKERRGLDASSIALRHIENQEKAFWNFLTYKLKYVGAIMGIGPENYVVIDIETTGINPTSHYITEIGGVKVQEGQVVEHFSQLINPEVAIPAQITRITGIDNKMVATAPTFDQIVPDFLSFVGDVPLIGHNILFDFSFLKFHCMQCGYSFERNGIDTLAIAKLCLPTLKSRSLTYLIDHFDIEREKAHRAYHDALATYALFEILKNRFEHMDQKIFDAKPLHWRPRKSSPITPRQKSYLKALIKKHGIFEEVSVDHLSKSEASQYIDRIRFLKGC